MTEETALVEVHLSTIAETKTKLSFLREQITNLEEQAGIPALRDEVKTLEKVYEVQIAQAVALNLFSEDHYQLINKGRVNTVIDAHKTFSAIPEEIFWAVIKVGKGELEKKLKAVYEAQGLDSKTIKKHVEAVLDGISTKEQGQNYELIDLLEGE